MNDLNKSFEETAKSILLQYRAELRQGLNELAGHDPLDQAVEALLVAISTQIIGEDEKSQWSNDADTSNDEWKYCTRCEFSPSEDYDKCECSIKDELRATQRQRLRGISSKGKE